MVHRLVRMIIVGVPHHILRCLFKEVGEVRYHFLTTAHQLHHSIYIVRHEPTLLIWVRFNSSVSVFHTAFRRHGFPAAVLFSWTKPTGRAVEDVPVTLCPLAVPRFVGSFSQLLSEVGQTTFSK